MVVGFHVKAVESLSPQEGPRVRGCNELLGSESPPGGMDGGGWVAVPLMVATSHEIAPRKETMVETIRFVGIYKGIESETRVS